MPRLKKETERKRTQSKILEWAAKQGIDTSEIKTPLMTDEEQLLEAQAVLNYFERNGEGFHYETCSNPACGMKFAYSYHYNGIKTCSIECMADNLRRVGINWHYGRDLNQRWDRYYPAIVPGVALALEDDKDGDVPSDVPEKSFDPIPLPYDSPLQTQDTH